MGLVEYSTKIPQKLKKYPKNQFFTSKFLICGFEVVGQKEMFQHTEFIAKVVKHFEMSRKNMHSVTFAMNSVC